MPRNQLSYLLKRQHHKLEIKHYICTWSSLGAFKYIYYVNATVRLT